MAFPAKTSEPRGLVRGFHCVRCSDVSLSIRGRVEYVKPIVPASLSANTPQVMESKRSNRPGYRNRLPFARFRPASFFSIVRDSGYRIEAARTMSPTGEMHPGLFDRWLFPTIRTPGLCFPVQCKPGQLLGPAEAAAQPRARDPPECGAPPPFSRCIRTHNLKARACEVLASTSVPIPVPQYLPLAFP
jgi:hypothetical protein